ncbi:MAG: hypothetical protein E7299_04895 [Lachnospiraceae bacterium]|nr:hypothetical protein [Lachnospiraceae bacterium]
MSRTKARKERLERVRERYLKKIKEEDIAKEMNLSLSTVRGYISEMGLKKRDWNAIREKIIEMYNSGRNFEDIEEETGVCRDTIRKTLKKSGLLSSGRFYAVENNLIDENTVFADNRVKIEKIVIYGKRYQDVTQVLVPR